LDAADLVKCSRRDLTDSGASWIGRLARELRLDSSNRFRLICG
jgi:hypothetical protein